MNLGPEMTTEGINDQNQGTGHRFKYFPSGTRPILVWTWCRESNWIDRTTTESSYVLMVVAYKMLSYRRVRGDFEESEKLITLNIRIQQENNFLTHL